MTRIEELEQIAKAATGGPWFAHACMAGKNTECWCMVVGTSAEPSHEEMDAIVSSGSVGKLNAEHIAAFDPPTVLALIEDWKNMRSALMNFAAQSSGHAHIAGDCLTSLKLGEV